MAWSTMADVPNPIFDANGDPYAGAVLKAYLPGTTTSTSIAINSDGGSPQTSITANSEGKWEVSGAEVVPHISIDHKWGIFSNASHAASNTPFYMGPFDNISVALSGSTLIPTQEPERLGSEASSQLLVLTEVSAIAGVNSVFVDVNGIVFTYGIDFSIPSANNILFTSPLNNDDKIHVSGFRQFTVGATDASSVTYLPGGTGAVATNVQAKLRSKISVIDFGATGNGLADDTTKIQAALTEATPTGADTFTRVGGNTVEIPPGVWGFKGEIVIPEFVNIKGAGKGISVLKALDAAATIRFGQKSSAFVKDERGGESGGFTIDGNGLSNLGLHIGWAVERGFSDIDVVNCNGASNGDGILIEAAQNCNFVGVSAQHNGGTAGSGCNIVLDYGAGNNRFYGAEINRPGQYNIKFIQSGTSPSGAFSVPTSNRFYGPMIERWEDQDDTGNLTALGTIYHGAGRANLFDHPDISATGVPSAFPIVKIRKDGSGASTLLTFNNPKFHGTASQTVAVDIDDATNIHLVGVSFFENHGTVFKVGATSDVHVNGEIEDSSGGTFFANQGGANTRDSSVFFPPTDIVRKHSRTNAADVAMSIAKIGESFNRWDFRPNQIAAGPGSGATDVTLSRDSTAGVASWKMNTAVLEIGASGIVIVTGVPTIAAADGYFALRTDGGVGSTLYHRTGSAWVARA